MIRPLKKCGSGDYRSADGKWYFWRDDNRSVDPDTKTLAYRPGHRWDWGRVETNGDCTAEGSTNTLGDAVTEAERKAA